MGPAKPVTQITAQVLLFAQLKDIFEADGLSVSLTQGSTARDLIRRLALRRPKANGVLEVSRLAVNCEYVSLDHVLQDQDEVVIVPPVSGG